MNDMQPELDTAKLPISVDVYPEEDHYTLLFEYDGRLYGRDDIACFARAFINTARNFTKAEYVREAALISDAETDAILALSEGERFSFDTEQTWLDLFLAQAAKTPTRTAVVDAESSYTYEALNRASDRIATYLMANGVAQNHFVGVKMGRVKEFHAAVLGIHKAGAAYLPIDPEYPEERIQWYTTEMRAGMMDEGRSPCIKRFLTHEGKDCTAVLCHNDEVARSLIQVMETLGLRCPEDVAVCSFDNTYYSEMGPTPITSLAHENGSIGRISAQALVNLIQGQEAQSQRVEWDLIPKKST
jgi:hypothetical protein